MFPFKGKHDLIAVDSETAQTSHVLSLISALPPMPYSAKDSAILSHGDLSVRMPRIALAKGLCSHGKNAVIHTQEPASPAFERRFHRLHTPLYRPHGEQVHTCTMHGMQRYDILAWPVMA